MSVTSSASAQRSAARVAWLPLRLALRELRSGKRRFTVFLSCLVLGVFAIAAVGSVSESARSAIGRDARILLGGDASLQLTEPSPTAEQMAWLRTRGLVSHTLSLRGMAHARGGELPDSTLVALKGVDAAYPLYGEVTLQPSIPLSQALAAQSVVSPSGERETQYGAVVDALLLERLALRVGDTVMVGDAPLRISAILEKEPDRAVQGVTFGPRVLVSTEGLRATGLVLPGSLLRSHVRVRLFPEPHAAGADADASAATVLPPGMQTWQASETQVEAFAEDARMAFPDAGWRVESYTRAAPRVRTFLDRLDTDLLLIGLGALLVGGLGIAEAVRGYLASRISHIATLKCVGGDVRTVLGTYFLQIMLVGMGGILLGCALGAVAPLLATQMLRGLLPVALDASVHWQPLVRAGLLGVGIIVAFSLRPLLLAGAVPPAVLFRGYTGTERTRLTTNGRIAVAAAFAGLAGLVLALTPDTRMALGFAAVVVGCSVVFRGVAWGTQALSRRLPRFGHPSLRLGIAAIHRPGAPTTHLVFALGLGLTALVAVSQIEQNMSSALERDLSREAPAFFFINILPDQLAEFDSLSNAPGVTRMEQGPMVRGRIIRIAGTPVERAVINPDVQWAVRGDRGLSHAAAMPRDTELVAGEWWPEDYAGPPRISLTDDLARGFGVTVGDTLSFNILGREVTAVIANIRKVDWMTFQLQFAVLFAPGLLEHAPVTWISTVYGSGPGMDALYRDVTTRYPNVTAFSMREILADVQNLMFRMGMVFRAMAGVMLLTGLLVLAGAVLADRHRRMYDAVIYKVCGATRRDILLALVVEFSLVGLVTGVFSAGTGVVAAWAAVQGLLHLPFAVHLPSAALTVLAGMGISLLVGLAGTARALNSKPAPYLRYE